MKIEQTQTNTKTQTYKVKGMHCAACAYSIEKTLKDVEGVADTTANFTMETAKVSYDPAKVRLTQMNAALSKVGYELLDHGYDHMEHQVHETRKTLKWLLPLVFLVFGYMGLDIFMESSVIMLPFELPKTLISYVLGGFATIVLFGPGLQFVKAIYRFVRFGSANMDTLVGLGTSTAYIYSLVSLLLGNEARYFDVTIVVIGFILLGKYLESNSKAKTSEAISKLINLGAKTCLIIRNGVEQEIPVENVAVWDTVIIKPGGKIPVDGEVIEGFSTVDESTLTGEAMPVEKSVGTKVISGTLNQKGTFKFTAQKVGSDTALANIIKIVQEASSSKAPIQKLADQISQIFVPIILVIAGLSFVVWYLAGNPGMGLVSMVTVLVIACPCALGLATPTAIIVGVGKAAQNGILIKNAESLEKLSKVKTLVSDKTGTLTTGKPEVTKIISNGLPEEEIIKLAASLENNSEHPMATAIISKSNKQYYTVSNFLNEEGKGISGDINGKKYFIGNIKFTYGHNINIGSLEQQLLQGTDEGKTPLILFEDGKVLGIIFVSDTPKTTAATSVANLLKMGVETIMLTGDHKNSAQFIAKQIGITNVVSDVLPNEKYDLIKKLQAQGKMVGMAGDGVNDAPALAAADVSIAMANGSDIAIDSSDITILHGDISKIEKAIKLSHQTNATIRQNLFWAFIYNVIGIPIAAGALFPFFGITLNPMLAGAAMALSSVSVVTNSLRLKVTKL